MTHAIPMVLSALLLVASPTDEVPDDPILQAQAFLTAASLLGAATGCDEIARDALSTTARQVSALAADQADNREELAMIDRLLMASAVAGSKALQEGKTDCKTVEASFHKLERIVLQTPIALKRG